MPLPLSREVEKFLRETRMPPTVFGRHALGDPRFVYDLRGGRECGARIVGRVRAFITLWRARADPVYRARAGGRPGR